MRDQDRDAARNKTLMAALVIFNKGRSTMECQVRNISGTGARLNMSNTVILPREFLLSMLSRKLTYHVQLRWRSHDAAGVKFLDITSQPAAEAHNVLDQEAEQLRAEIIQLRRENRELRVRLADLGHSHTISVAEM